MVRHMSLESRIEKHQIPSIFQEINTKMLQNTGKTNAFHINNHIQTSNFPVASAHLILAQTDTCRHTVGRTTSTNLPNSHERKQVNLHVLTLHEPWFDEKTKTWCSGTPALSDDEDARMATASLEHTLTVYSNGSVGQVTNSN